MAGRKKLRFPIPESVEHALDTGLDKALAVQRPVVRAYLERLRSRNPRMTPDQVARLLERRYLTAVVGIGGASGAAAAVPGTGTAASVATGAAEITGFLSATAMFVLGLAELHGIPMRDPDVRRALVLSILIGESGEAALRGVSGDRIRWAHVLGHTTSKEKIAGVNARLGQLLITRVGARQGALVFGRAIPLGIGAGIGAAGNAALARGVIMTARRAFGSAPSTFPPRVIDVAPDEPRRKRRD